VNLENSTAFPAAYTLGRDPDGREHLVVVVKATYAFPDAPDRPPALAAEQQPLVMGDTFTGEPGQSAPVLEADVAPIKPRCDILLIGQAHAPGGRAVKRVPVGLHVGTMQKQFLVVGDRHWTGSGRFVGISDPEPFTTLPISYDVAFGGIDDSHPDPDRCSAYEANPVGRGHRPHKRDLDGVPLPNTEEADRPVTEPDGRYTPMAFGPVGRGWLPRRGFAGTYDDAWLDDAFPFLPKDFDTRYYQAAPADQQTEFLRGGEPVILVNLTPQGRTQFTLPRVDLPIYLFPRRGRMEPLSPVIDTLVIEPEARRFCLVWRVRRPLRDSLFELDHLIVGRKSRAWWRAYETGKQYRPLRTA